MKPAAVESWTIVVRAEGEGPPAAIRVRRALKFLLRSHGLRCTRITSDFGKPLPDAPADLDPCRSEPSF